jgi:cytochrome b561
MSKSVLRYTKTAVVLHWLVAIGIFAMFALGWYMADLPKEAPKQMAYDMFDLGIYTWQLSEESSPRTFYFNLHKSLGVTLFALIAIRILWRLAYQPPALLATKALEKKLVNGMHHLLYLLMVVLPMSGIIMAAYSKYGIKWFGVSLITGLDNANVRDVFEEMHEVISIILLVVVVIHIAGALKHKFIDKDETLARMSLH